MKGGSSSLYKIYRKEKVAIFSAILNFSKTKSCHALPLIMMKKYAKIHWDPSGYVEVVPTTKYKK